MATQNCFTSYQLPDIHLDCSHCSQSWLKSDDHIVKFLTCDWSVVATSHFSLVENDKCSPNQTWLSDQVSLFGCFHLCLDAKIVDEVEKGLLVEPPFPVWIRDFAMTPPPSQKCFLTAFESFTFLIYTSFNGLKVKRICLQCLVTNVNLLKLHRKTLSIRLHR